MMQEHMLDTINGNISNTPPGMMNRAWPPQPQAGNGGGPGGGGLHEADMGLNGHEFVPPPHSVASMMTSVVSSTESGSTTSSASKKSSSRRNAWGNLSYADLITQAIQSTPEKRLTLSQVYEWMVANIPYFKDKGDSNSSAGWKNSIRHNLSLHSRFVRVQNEGTGKSSWWMLNPDAKPGGKTSRRRTASVEGNGNCSARGPDFKRRGRSKKNSNAVSAASGLRNGPDSTPSPGVHPGAGHLTAGAQSMAELYPESPSLHHPHQYPFPPGRMSPSGLGGAMADHPGAFGYQPEWAAASDYQCGPIPPYFSAGNNRGYCEPLCGEQDYPGRPHSPQQQQLLQQQQQQQLPGQRNGYAYSRSFPSPTTPSNNGNDNFHPFHTDKLPNHSLAEATTTFSSLPQVMSPSTGTGPSSMSPNNSLHNNNRGDNNSARSFSSPEAHRPSSTNNEPLVSPHALHLHQQQQQQQSFFPPSVASMRASSPGSPGSVKSGKNSSNGSSSILERALANSIKQEATATSTSGSLTMNSSNCIETSVAGGGHLSHMDHGWPPPQQQLHPHQHYDLGSEVFMKHEIDIGNLEYDIHYGNAVTASGGGHHPVIGGPPQGVVGPPHHHLNHLGPNRVAGGQEDHLHSPASQYSIQQQPPWVR